MIAEQTKGQVKYVSIIEKDPVLALSLANGIIARKRKNWVLVEVLADLHNGESQFVGLRFEPLGIEGFDEPIRGITT